MSLSFCRLNGIYYLKLAHNCEVLSSNLSEVVQSNDIDIVSWVMSFFLIIVII